MCRKYILAMLSTGFGKSLVFHLLSSLLAERKKRSGVLEKTVVLVIFTLNSLIQDQLQKINRVCRRAVVLSVKEPKLDQNNGEVEQHLARLLRIYIYTSWNLFVFERRSLAFSEQCVQIFRGRYSCWWSALHFGMVSIVLLLIQILHSSTLSAFHANF